MHCADETTPPVPPTRDAADEAALGRVRGLLDAVPDRIGPYRMLERLGHGGMGEVYVAEQTSPIKRRVAVKVIKAGMDTRQVVARFEAERQALAMMDHPNVARVFDAGATDAGRPYFVMELIRGTPITQYCDDHKLTTRQRIELLVPVCQAVQHAHQKGIIHRDLKPTNVLVTLHDGKPVPKVIDFGIAKATNARLTDKTVYTEFRQMIGTPAYMSPEQAEMSGLDIDTRSDVYSLGVLAYELLTGSTPFDGQRLIMAGLAEIGRIIKEEEPPRPSQRISTLGERLTTVATRRGSDAGRIGRLVAGELDWIVMKAMEKDRTRRYETANGLAADLGRYLAGEPVQAAPPSLAYRVSKVARRHKAKLLTAAALAAFLVVGTVVSVTQAVRATRAEAAASSQRDEAERQASIARQQRDAADAAKRQADASERHAVEEATNATQQTHYVNAQYLLSENRVGPALSAVRQAIAVRPRLEYGLLQSKILDAARDHWLPVGRAEQKVGPKAVACFAGEGKRTLAIADESTLLLIAADTGHVIGRRDTGGPADAIVACGDRVVVARPDRLLSFPLGGDAPPQTLPLDAPSKHLTADAAGRRIAVCSAAGDVRVVDAATFVVTHHQKFDFRTSRSVQSSEAAGTRGNPHTDFSPSGDRLLFHSGIWQHAAKLWDLAADTVEDKTLFQPIAVRMLDETQGVSLDRSNSALDSMGIHRTDLRTGQPGKSGGFASRAGTNFSVWRGHAEESGAARVLAAATSEDAIDFFDLSNPAMLGSDRFASLCPQYAAGTRFLAYHGPTGLLAVATDRDVWVFQSRVTGPAADRDITPAYDDTSFWSLAVSRDHVFTTPYTNNAAVVYRTAWDGSPAGAFECRLPELGDKNWNVWGMSVTPDGRSLAMLLQENSGGGRIDSDYFRKAIAVYDLTRPERPLRPKHVILLDEHANTNGRDNRLLTLAADGRTVAFSATGRPTTIFRTDDGSVVAKIGRSGFQFASPDQTLLGTQTGPTTELWRIGDGQRVFSTTAGGYLQSAAVSPDNRRVYIGQREGVVECFDLATSERVSSVQTRLMPVAVWPEHNRVIGFISAGGATGSLAIGDLATGQTIVVLNEGAHFLNRAYFNSAGNAVAFVRSRNHVGLVPPGTIGQAELRLGQTFPVVALKPATRPAANAPTPAATGPE